MHDPHDRPPPSRRHHPPTASAELLPVLVWLNRRELASRFPAWQDAGEPDTLAPRVEPRSR